VRQHVVAAFLGLFELAGVVLNGALGEMGAHFLDALLDLADMVLGVEGRVVGHTPFISSWYHGVAPGVATPAHRTALRRMEGPHQDAVSLFLALLRTRGDLTQR
jgi:hypothetical protein